MEMNRLVPWIWMAGVIQCVIAIANIAIPGKLQYAENLAKVSVIVRQVFIVHAVYIVGMLLAFAVLCFGFASELTTGHGLGRAMSALLAVFWGVRLPVQLFYYDTQPKRQHRVAHALFSLMFGYLAAVFALAAVTGGG